jgi:type II secretory pathway predicted ATPase ExeA
MRGELGHVSPAVVFGKPRPEPFWAAPVYAEALAFALARHSERRTALLVGPRGCGKSTTLTAFLSRAPHSVFFRFRERWEGGAALLAALADSTGLPAAAAEWSTDEARVLAFLEAQRERGNTTIFAVDDAELLPPDAWQLLHRLASIDLGGYRPHLLLVGRPETETGLQASPAWAGVALSTFRLRAPRPADVMAYIDFRLAAAGLEPSVFQQSARERIAHSAGGSLARVDLLCQGAMLLAARRSIGRVGGDLVCEAEETFGRGDDPARVIPATATRAPAAAVRPDAGSRPPHLKVANTSST